MRKAAPLALLLVGIGVTFASCSRFGPVYPARPAPGAAPALADPEPSRVVVHLTLTHDGLAGLLDQSVPASGDGKVPLLGSDRAYTWTRGPMDLAFVQGRIEMRAHVQATLDTPIKKLSFPLEVRVLAEPVVASTYVVKLQAVEVHVTSPDRAIGFADQIAGVYGKIEEPIGDKLRAFVYDLRPLLGEAYAHVQDPIKLPIGDADACARLEVLEIEAAPTVLADGIEKDVAFVVKPSITMPCPVLNYPDPPELPPLSNVASLPTGPSVVTVPIAAKYDELTRAMTMAFTDGKLFFSKDFPEVFLEKPELYESQGQLVLKLHISGPVHRMGIDTDLDGDLFLAGHPQVIDNELTIPDLQPTIETSNFLLSLKAMTSGDSIRDQARAALRLDIGARIHDAQDKLGDQLTFGGKGGCFKGSVDRVEVPGVYPHAGYLRVQVAVTGRARADVPCAAPATAVPQ